MEWERVLCFASYFEGSFSSSCVKKLTLPDLINDWKTCNNFTVQKHLDRDSGNL